MNAGLARKYTAETLDRVSADRKHFEDQAEEYRLKAEECRVIEERLRSLVEDWPLAPPVAQMKLDTIPSAERLREQSIHESLVEMARTNGGWIRSRDAITPLVNAGMFHTRMGATNAIHSALSRSPMFIREKRGVYRFAEAVSVKVDIAESTPPVEG